MYDICVVGAGIVGSAAARWLSKQPETRVCLIGAPEPASDEEWKNSRRTVFGAHYDEGRIATGFGRDPWDQSWPVLIRRTLSRYKDLEKESGIPFFNEVGFLMKSSKHRISELRKLPTESPAHVLSAEDLSRSFPYLRCDEDVESIFETRNSGTMNPRRYIAANKKVASQNSCDVIDDIVQEIKEQRHLNGNISMVALTQGGRTISAKRVLLCTGGFVNFERLLPRGKEVDITMTTELCVLIEMHQEDVSRMRDMPPIIVEFDDVEGDPRNNYILPPIKYPDGKYYMKIGHGFYMNRPITSHQEVASWYRRQDNVLTEDFFNLYLRIYDTVTGFRPKSLHTMTCVTTFTPTGRYYCDMVTPTLGVATGGNGSGACAGDEVGRMAAQMILQGGWDHDLPAELFKLRYKEKGPSKSKL